MTTTAPTRARRRHAAPTRKCCPHAMGETAVSHPPMRGVTIVGMAALADRPGQSDQPDRPEQAEPQQRESGRGTDLRRGFLEAMSAAEDPAFAPPGTRRRPDEQSTEQRPGTAEHRPGPEARTDAIDTALDRAGLPAPRERAREEPGTRDRAENIRFSDAMTDIELTAKGDKVVNRAPDKESRFERIRKTGYEVSGDVKNIVTDGGDAAEDLLSQRPPSGHAEVRAPHPVMEVPHHATTGDSVIVAAAFMAVMGEGIRAGVRHFREQRKDA